MKLRIILSILTCITGGLVSSLVSVPARAATAGMVVRQPAAGFLNGSISVGGFFSCGIRTPGDTILCWGDDTQGQLDGTPSTSTHQGSPPGGGIFTQVSAGFTHTCGIRTNGTVLCWGDDTDGELDGVPSSSTYQGSPPAAASSLRSAPEIASPAGSRWTGPATAGAMTITARSTAYPRPRRPTFTPARLPRFFLRQNQRQR